MRVVNCLCVALLSLSIFWLSGCATVVPDLSYSGPVKDEDTAFIRKSLSDKGIGEEQLGKKALPLATDFFFLPFLYMKVDQLSAHKVKESVVGGCDTGDPIRRANLRSFGTPLMLYGHGYDRRISPDGRFVWRHDLSVVSFLLWSWGDFEYADRRNVAKKMAHTGIACSDYFLLNPAK